MTSPSIPTHELPGQAFLASDKPTAFGPHGPSHRINFYALIWFREQGGPQLIDFDRYPIRRNMIYLLSRNQVHSIPGSRLPAAWTIVFSTEFFERIREPELRDLFLPFHSEGIRIPKRSLTSMETLFGLILQEQRGEADPGLLLILLTAFLMQLNRLAQDGGGPASGADERMLSLFSLLEKNYKDQRTANFYAGGIGLTAKRINEILRQRMGTTISQLLYHRLLTEAKRELYHNERSVKEIAYDLGFSDQSYFARFFRKNAGMGPEEFRRKAGAVQGRQHRLSGGRE